VHIGENPDDYLSWLCLSYTFCNHCWRRKTLIYSFYIDR